MFLLAGAMLVCVSKPKRMRNLLWLPFVFSYWCLQAFIALYAAVLILLRRPQVWLKTEKKGTVANSAFILDQEGKFIFEKPSESDVLGRKVNVSANDRLSVGGRN